MSKRIRVRVPVQSTLLQFPSGDEVVVKVDSVGRFADLLEDDARILLNSGLPTSIPWRELNPSLVDTLKPLPRAPAVRLVDLERAAELAQPINPFDRAAIARQTLLMWRGGL